MQKRMGLRSPVLSSGPCDSVDQVSVPARFFRPEFPVVGIDIFDAAGNSLAQHLCSGTRISWRTRGTHYHLYANPPSGKPHSVRFVVKQPGFVDFSETYSWDEAISGILNLQFQSDPPTQFLVIDASTGQGDTKSVAS